MKSTNEIVESLIRVKLSVGGGRCVVASPDLSAETAAAHDADARTIKTAVTWLPQPWRSSISKAASSLRSGFRERTLPWEDGGYRVVPAEKYLDLLEYISESKRAFMDACDSVADNWDEIMKLVDTKLNGLRKRVEVPDLTTWRRGVSVELDITPVTSPSDMNVHGLNGDVMKAIRTHVHAQYTGRITEAVEGLAYELVGLLKDLAGRLANPQQERIRYGGWKTWAERMVRCSLALNITESAAMDGLLNGLESVVFLVNGEALRSDAEKREKLRELCDRIIEEARKGGLVK